MAQDDWLEGGLATDQELMQRLVAMDESALGLLYDRYGGLCFSLALKMVGSPEAAEDIVQETFYRVWRQASGYDPQRARLTTWLSNITRNLCIDELRRRSARPQAIAGQESEELMLAVATSPDVDPGEQAWLAQRSKAVQDALSMLPAAQREALELAYFSGLSQSEIADHLGDPLGTIKTRIRLGMLKLRDTLGSNWWIDEMS